MEDPSRPDKAKQTLLANVTLERTNAEVAAVASGRYNGAVQQPEEAQQQSLSDLYAAIGITDKEHARVFKELATNYGMSEREFAQKRLEFSQMSEEEKENAKAEAFKALKANYSLEDIELAKRTEEAAYEKKAEEVKGNNKEMTQKDYDKVQLSVCQNSKNPVIRKILADKNWAAYKGFGNLEEIKREQSKQVNKNNAQKIHNNNIAAVGKKEVEKRNIAPGPISQKILDEKARSSSRKFSR